VRVLAIGRNEYIALLNECKGRRIMWRINRAGVVRELLPTAPVDVRPEPWWRVACVNVGARPASCAVIVVESAQMILLTAVVID
jgi:hypothetical protein